MAVLCQCVNLMKNLEDDNMINVTNEDGKVIARVNYNSNLDNWNGRNWTSGSVGKHLGITKLKKSGQYVLIHGTQYEGEKNTAEIISPEEAFQVIMQTNHEDLLEKYPDLKEFEHGIETEEV